MVAIGIVLAGFLVHPGAQAGSGGSADSTIIDVDQDGLDDLLEQDLAEHYLPSAIWFHGLEDCAWPATESSSGLAVYRVRRDPRDADLLSITYSLHYREDCGSFLGIDSHPGDIESFAVALAPDVFCSLGWRLHSIMTTAHSGGPANTELALPGACTPSAELLVSRGKHATYLTAEACDSYIDPFQKCGRGFTSGFHMVQAGEDDFRLADDLSAFFPSQPGEPEERIWSVPGDGRFCGGLPVADRSDCVGATGRKLLDDGLLPPIRSFNVIFQGGEDWSVGTRATGIAFGDVDGDGLDEVGVTRTADPAGQVLLFDDERRQFAPLSVVFSGWGPRNAATSIAFGDVDGDGLDEIGVTRLALHGARIYIYDDAARDFAPLLSLGARWGPRAQATDLAFGDVDGDGLAEVGIARRSPRGPRVYVLDDALHDFDRLTIQGEGWRGGRQATGIAFGEVDGDGRAEIGVTRSAPDGDRVYVFDDAANGFAMLFHRGREWGPGRFAARIAFGDVDGDGADEVAVARRILSGDRLFLFDDADRGFAELYSAGDDWEPGFYRVSAALGDGDGDGREEILAGRGGDFTSGVFLYQRMVLGDGFGMLATGESGAVRLSGVAMVDFGDVTGDRRREVGLARSDRSGARFQVIRILAPGDSDSPGAP